VRRNVVAALAGLVFAFGLALSGMTNPGKVIAFLDVTGAWDPSLAFVMGGAIAVHFLIPGPLSVSTSSIWLLSRGSTRSRTRPFAGVNFIALPSRFDSTCTMRS
jgi:hypothetical protein